MMIIAARKLVAAVLVLLAVLPALAQGMETQAKPVAVQMYTLRDIATLEARLKLVHDAGVRAIETVGTQGVPAAELGQLLDKYSIRVIASHTQLADLRADFDAVVAFNAAIGNSILVVPYLQDQERPTDAAGWVALGEELGEISKRAQASGMTLAYHNHDFEIVDFNGKTGLELMLEAAGPEVKAEIDVAWIALAGYDPAAFLARFPGRVFAIHAKDNGPQGQAEEGGFAALGKGVLDWNAILPAAAAAGVQWYIIEHDQPRDPASVIRIGAAYLDEHLVPRAPR